MAIKVSNILNSIETNFVIEFDSKNDAQIIYNSILPEIEAEKNDRSKSNIELDDEKITINITSYDVVSLRASINSYIRWINLSEEILKI